VLQAIQVEQDPLVMLAHQAMPVLEQHLAMLVHQIQEHLVMQDLLVQPPMLHRLKYFRIN
jgi:hypothetical protein